MVSVQRTHRWSGVVTRKSNALDLETGVFKLKNPKQIALSLKQSAVVSHRRKGTPFQSARSMLNFYINRAGSGLSGAQKAVLARAKNQLRELYNKPRPENPL